MIRNACTSLLSLCALAAITASISGCAVSSDPPEEVLGESSAAMSGNTFLFPSTNGIVRIRGASAKGVLQGVLMTPKYVLTALPGLGSTRSLDLTVQARPDSQGRRESVRVIDFVKLPLQQLALLRLASPMVERPVTLDSRAYNGPTEIRCKQLQEDGTFRAANVLATPNSGGVTFTMTTGFTVVDTNAGDFGLACGDGASVKGLVFRGSPQGTVLMSNLTDLLPFINAQDEVFKVRESGMTTPFSLSVFENGVSKCLQTTPFVQMAPCNPLLKSQEFYFDQRNQSASGMAILSSANGLCLGTWDSANVPPILANAATAPVFTAACSQRVSQNFAMTFTPNFHVQYVTTFPRRCLTSSNGGAMMTTDCSEVPARNWFITWRL